MAKPAPTRMSTKVRDARLNRVQLILRLLADEALPVEVLTERLSKELEAIGLPRISERSVNDDIAWLRERFGGGGVERVARSALEKPPASAFRTYRSFYRLVPGDGLIPAQGDGLLALTEIEALALTTARAMLSRAPAREGRRGERGGPLAEALDRILDRLGINKPEIIPDIIDVCQTTQQVWDAEVLRTLLRAVRTKQGVTGTYQSLQGAAHPVHLNPVRLMLNYDEWHVWAWNGSAPKVRNYKVSRFSDLALAERLPGEPTDTDRQSRRNVAEGFEGYAGERMEDVSLRFKPEAAMKVVGRHMGLDQKYVFLPDGSVRISFRTRGMAALRPWVLGFGDQVVWERGG